MRRLDYWKSLLLPENYDASTIRRLTLRAIVWITGLTLAWYVWHQHVGSYERTRPWKAAPIISVERTCPRPTYETLADQSSDIKPTTTRTTDAALPAASQIICMTTFTDEKKRATAQKLYGWRSFDGMLDITWKNKQSYANKHGYQLFDESNQVDKSRPPGWSKVPAVRRLFKEENCTWVFFLDADTVIMDSARKLEEFIPTDPTKHLVMAPDKTMKNGYNSGAWFLRNSEWSLDLLEKWWSKTWHVRQVGISKSGDQAGLNACLKGVFAENGQGLAPKQCNFNSFAAIVDPKEYPDHEVHFKQKEYFLSEYYYHKGDFLMHAAGVDNKEVVVREFLELAT